MDIEMLEKLQKLKESGALTQEEFQIEKEKILNKTTELKTSDAVKIKCPKCKSTNVSIQREEVGSVGTSKTKYKGKKSKGLLYYVFIGWWIWIIKLLFLPITIIFGKKGKSFTSTTVNANKTFNKTIAVCQSCGYSWNIKN